MCEGEEGLSGRHAKAILAIATIRRTLARAEAVHFAKLVRLNDEAAIFVTDQ